jgi:hypothetical protein
MAKPPVYGGKKKPVARRSADASEGAAKAAQANEFRKFGDFLAGKDVVGRGRGIAAKQRQADLKKYVAATGAAGVASGYGTVGAKKKSTKKVGSAAAEVRAAKNAKMKKPRVPKTM